MGDAMKITKKYAFSVSASLVAMISAAPAFAEANDSTDDQDTIVVTATLREADVQDIPLAVTAVMPATLERQGVADIKTLSSITPSFNIQSSQTETQGTSIKIRGVGTTGNNTGLESSVGVFIDGVYQSRPGVALGDLVDVERLEVLRGPQGTLFGRNTSAGALNVTTKRAKLNEVEGFANLSAGNYDFLNVQAGINAPLVKDVAALRVVGTWRKRDGYLKSSTGAESNNRDRWMLRGQLYIEPSSNVSIRLLADYSKVDEKCCDAVIMRETPLNVFASANGLTDDGVDQSGETALKNLSSNGGQFLNSSEQWGTSGEIKVDFGGAQLTSITSYRDFKAESSQDEFVGLQLYSVGSRGVTAGPNTPPSFDDIKAFTQEVRLQGKAFNDKLDWLIGGFYGHEDIVAQASMTLGKDFQAAASAFNLGPVGAPNYLKTLTALGNLGTPVDAAGAFGVNKFTQEATTFSIFTHNVVSLTDKLNLTLGARYVDEKKDGAFDQLSASNPACQAIVNATLTGQLPVEKIRNAALGITCFPFVAPVNLTAPVALGGGLASKWLPVPREWAQTFKDNELTYTAQLAYKPTEDVMVYGSFSHGFKSGGFNLDATAANLINSKEVVAGLGTVAPIYADPSFKSEKVDAYELGMKATLGRINANVALFQMDMSDFQVLEFTGVQFTTFNVAGARSRGFEVEVFGRVTDNFSINASVTHAVAKYDKNCTDGVAAGNVPTVALLCGQDLTNAPRWAGVAGVTYDGPLASTGWGLVANANVSYSGRRRTATQALDVDSDGVITSALLDWQEEYAKVNARIGFTDPSDRYTIELWGTNLTNQITRGITSNTPLRGPGGANRSRIAFVEEPRMYGVTVRVKY